MFLGSLSTKIVQIIWKNMAARGGASFPYMSVVKTLKIFFLENSWLNFKIILYRCSLGACLPRLLKLVYSITRTIFKKDDRRILNVKSSTDYLFQTTKNEHH